LCNPGNFYPAKIKIKNREEQVLNSEQLAVALSEKAIMAKKIIKIIQYDM
jgi:hypothetical protein